VLNSRRFHHGVETLLVRADLSAVLVAEDDLVRVDLSHLPEPPLSYPLDVLGHTLVTRHLPLSRLASHGKYRTPRSVLGGGERHIPPAQDSCLADSNAAVAEYQDVVLEVEAIPMPRSVGPLRFPYPATEEPYQLAPVLSGYVGARREPARRDPVSRCGPQISLRHGEAEEVVEVGAFVPQRRQGGLAAPQAVFQKLRHQIVVQRRHMSVAEERQDIPLERLQVRRHVVGRGVLLADERPLPLLEHLPDQRGVDDLASPDPALQLKVEIFGEPPCFERIGGLRRPSDVAVRVRDLQANVPFDAVSTKQHDPTIASHVLVVRPLEDRFRRRLEVSIDRIANGLRRPFDGGWDVLRIDHRRDLDCQRIVNTISRSTRGTRDK